MLKNTRRKNTQKGITLIALVVTIIVLLILAGISISMLTGNKGILTQATRANEQTKIEGTAEQIKLAVASAQLEGRGGINLSELNKELTQIGYTGEEITKLPAAIDLEGSKYTIAQDGTVKDLIIKWKDDGNGNLTDGTTTIKIGDYIDYNEQIEETEETEEIEGKTIYTSEASKNGYGKQVFKLNSYTYGWRVLGVDETTGELLLLAEDLVAPSTGGYTDDSTGRTYYYLQGREGYANGVDELNKISSLYGQGKYSIGARSITVEDVNKVTGYNPETAKYGAGNIYEYGNKVTYYWDGTNKPYYEATNALKSNLSGYHSNFLWFDEESKEWKSSPCASSEEASTENKKEITTLESNYYYYQGSSYINSTSEGYKMLFTNSATGANTANAGSTTGFYYWLGSRYVFAYSGYVDFGVRQVDNGNMNEHKLAVSNGGSDSDSSGVRPVVSLRSDIKINTEGKDGTSGSPYTLSE